MSVRILRTGFARIATIAAVFAVALPSAAHAQNQTLDTANGTACTDAGGILSGSNLFTAADFGSFGTGSGAINEIPATNPFSEITGGIYQPSYGTFPHGSFTIISNQVNRRNGSQFNGTQIDPVNGVNGRFFVSDPAETSPILTSSLSGLVEGQSYEVVFWVADTEDNQNGAKQRIGIVIDGNTASPVFTTPFINSNGGGNANNPVVWQKWSHVYTHNSANSTITFGIRAVETGGSGRDIFLDEISVTQCSFATDLVTQKTLASTINPVSTGDVVSYLVTVTNNGTDAANNVAVTDQLPAGLTANGNNGNATLGTYNAGSGLWSIGSLAPGASATLTIEGTVDPDLSAGTNIQNVTTAAIGVAGDPTTVDDDLTETVTVASNPALSMTKVADDDALVTVGQIVTYTYTVTNNGNETIRNVVVGDDHNGDGPAPTPTGETLTTNNSGGGSSDITPDDGVWSVLAPDDVVTFTGTYTVLQADIDNLQ